MIVTKTPFRVTLAGGGTDLPSYYERHGGMILAMGIDLHMYVSILTSQVDRRLRVQYTKTEVVDHPDQLQHELVREALKRYRIYSRMEVSSIADLPSGAGLGSSSCYMVGLLTALRAYRRTPCTKQELAEEACELEINRLKMPIGKQNQYMATFGGMTALEIDSAGGVVVREAKVNPSTLPDLLANTQLYYTGVRRSEPGILRDQDAAMRAEGSPRHDLVQGCLHGIKAVGYGILEAIEGENYDEFGRLMDQHWQHKRQMSPKIMIPGIQELYDNVKRRFGVLGGKVSGAGGGGFFMVYAPAQHAELAAFMQAHGLIRLNYGLDYDGARVVVNSTSPGAALLAHDPVDA